MKRIALWPSIGQFLEMSSVCLKIKYTLQVLDGMLFIRISDQGYWSYVKHLCLQNFLNFWPAYSISYWDLCWNLHDNCKFLNFFLVLMQILVWILWSHIIRLLHTLRIIMTLFWIEPFTITNRDRDYRLTELASSTSWAQS